MLLCFCSFGCKKYCIKEDFLIKSGGIYNTEINQRKKIGKKTDNRQNATLSETYIPRASLLLSRAREYTS